MAQSKVRCALSLEPRITPVTFNWPLPIFKFPYHRALGSVFRRMRRFSAYQTPAKTFPIYINYNGRRARLKVSVRASKGVIGGFATSRFDSPQARRRCPAVFHA